MISFGGFLSFNQGQKAWEQGQKWGVGRDCASYRRGEGIWSLNLSRQGDGGEQAKRGVCSFGAEAAGSRESWQQPLGGAGLCHLCHSWSPLRVGSRLQSPALVLSLGTAVRSCVPHRPPAAAPSGAGPRDRAVGTSPAAGRTPARASDRPSA